MWARSLYGMYFPLLDQCEVFFDERKNDLAKRIEGMYLEHNIIIYIWSHFQEYFYVALIIRLVAALGPNSRSFTCSYSLLLSVTVT